MKNLLEETRSVLKESKIEESEVIWCGSPKAWFTWAEFIEVADVDYDDGYGSNDIASDLLVVGKDWWLERGEYDGSEWWEFKRRPDRPNEQLSPASVLNLDYDDKVTFKE